MDLPKDKNNNEHTRVIASLEAINASKLEAPSKLYGELGLPMSWWNSPKTLFQSWMWQSSIQSNEINYDLFVYLLRHNTDKPTLEHMRQLTTKQVVCQVKRRFHNRELNRQPLP